MINKCLTCVFALGLLAGWSTVTHASDSAWGLAGTYWDTEDGDDTAGASFRLNIQPLEAAHTRVDFRLSYYENVLPNSAPLGAELAVTPIELGLSLHTSPKGPLNAYIGGGLSFCFMDTTSNASDEPFSSGDELGYYGFIGFEGTISGESNFWLTQRTTLFIEGSYRAVDVDALAPGDTEGGTLDGAALNAGILFYW